MLRSTRRGIGRLYRAVIVSVEVALFALLMCVVAIEFYRLFTYVEELFRSILGGGLPTDYTVTEVVSEVLLILVMLEIARTLLASLVTEREISLTAIIEAVFIASARKLIAMAMVTVEISEIYASLVVASVFFIMWIVGRRVESG